MRSAAATLLVLALCAVPGAATADGGQAKREDCGKYSSASIYPKAKVIAIRGVDCGEARKVAKKYDHKGAAKGKWQVRSRPRRRPPAVLVRLRRHAGRRARLPPRPDRQGRRQVRRAQGALVTGAVGVEDLTASA